MKLEALEHINIDNFDQLVRDRCLDLDKSDSLAANVAYFSRDIRQKLENRARLFSWEVEPHNKFGALMEIAISGALNELVRDLARLEFETFYLQCISTDGGKNHPSMFLGAVEETVRKNPKIDVTDNTGKIINANAKVRLSSAMLLFGAIASAARISMRTSGEPEVWDSNLDIAVGMQYALNMSKESRDK